MKKKDYPFTFHASRFTLHVLLFLGLLLFLFTLPLLPSTTLAQSPPLTVTPTSLTLTGLIGGGPLATSLHLTAGSPITNVQILASDLQDVSGDGRFRDAIPGSKVTVLPAAQITTLVTNSLTALVIQMEPLAQAGTYSGTLTIRWQEPEPGELILPLTVIARTQPSLAIQEPSQLVINAEPGQRITRQIVLRETVGGSSLTGLRVIPGDLLTAGSEVAIPAQVVNLTLPGVISGGQVATVALTIDLTHVAAGAYTGQTLFTWDNGQVVSLPLDLKVRVNWFWPVVWLVIGVVLGSALTWYQEKGQLRDEVTLRLAVIRQAMTEDKEIIDNFGPRLNPAVDLVELEMRAGRWAEAQKALAQPEALVNKWRGTRTVWIELFKILGDQIRGKLGSEDEETLLGRSLKLKADNLAESAADLPTPAEFRQQLNNLKDELLSYLTLKAQLKTMGNAQSHPGLTPEQKAEWKTKQAEFDRRFKNLSPTDMDGRNQLAKELDEALQQINKQILTPAATAEDFSAKGGRGLANILQVLLPLDFIIPNLISTADPTASPTNFKLIQTIVASRRFIFTVVAYLLSIVLVIGTGYMTLYTANPTFGATVADYLTLFTWALTGQATVTTLAGKLINWGLGRSTPTPA